MSRSYINVSALQRQRHRAPTSNQEFHLFSEIPVEIRRMIWKEALPPRMIPIEELYTPSAPHLSIPLLAVNQESRSYVLERYSVWGEFTAPSTHIFDTEDIALTRYNNYNRGGMFMGTFTTYVHPINFFSWNYVDFARDVIVIDNKVLGMRDGEGFGMDGVVGVGGFGMGGIFGMGSYGMARAQECLFRRNARSEGLKRVKNVAFDHSVNSHGVWREEERSEHLQNPILANIREELAREARASMIENVHLRSLVFKGLERLTVIRGNKEWLNNESVRFVEVETEDTSVEWVRIEKDV